MHCTPMSPRRLEGKIRDQHPAIYFECHWHPAQLSHCACADHKKWNVEEIQVMVSNVRDQYKTTFQCNTSVKGDIDERQRTRLLEIAQACPIHKVLKNPISVESEMKLNQ